MNSEAVVYQLTAEEYSKITSKLIGIEVWNSLDNFDRPQFGSRETFRSLTMQQADAAKEAARVMSLENPELYYQIIVPCEFGVAGTYHKGKFTPYETLVVFRTFKKTKEVIALFPYWAADHNPAHCMSFVLGEYWYAPSEEWGAADAHMLVWKVTTWSRPEEYEKTKAYLEKQGYTLKIRRKLPSDHYRVRWDDTVEREKHV